MANDVYSYHTFMFPFIWNDGGKVSLSEFEKVLNEKWDAADRSNESFKDETDPDRKAWHYALHQYFNASARIAIFGAQSPKEEWVVKNWTFDRARFDRTIEQSDVDYIIVKSSKDQNIVKENKYKLRVNGIHLKIYNTGVGIVIFELENKDAKHNQLADINKINEHGRRIFFPFYAYEQGTEYVSCSLCADRLSIPEYESAEQHFSDKTQSGMKLNYISDTIKFLFANERAGKRYEVTTNAHKRDRNHFYIEPIIDDRMFVACYMADEALLQAAAEWDKEKREYRCISDAIEKKPTDETDADASVENMRNKHYANENIAQRLYEYVYIDGDGVSCLNRSMMRQLLSDSIYARWLEFRYEGSLCGSITGITDYSLMHMGSNMLPFLVNNFLNLYINIAILVLAQRASIIAIKNRITALLSKGQNNAKIRELYHDYVMFKCQMRFAEVTEQQQGIEMYNKMVTASGITELQETLDKQFDSLHELINVKSGILMNDIIIVLTVSGVFLTIASIYFPFFAVSQDIIPSAHWSVGIPVFLTALLAIILWIRSKRTKR